MFEQNSISLKKCWNDLVLISVIAEGVCSAVAIHLLLNRLEVLAFGMLKVILQGRWSHSCEINKCWNQSNGQRNKLRRKVCIIWCIGTARDPAATDPTGAPAQSHILIQGLDSSKQTKSAAPKKQAKEGLCNLGDATAAQRDEVISPWFTQRNFREKVLTCISLNLSVMFLRSHSTR